MTAPRVEDFPTLGFVPCGGDRHTVVGVVRTLKDTTDALAEAVRVLRGTAKGQWKGKTADAFADMLSDDFRPKMEKAHSSFNQARKALDDWAEYMLIHQKKAQDLEGDAAEAKRAQDAKKAEAKEEGHKDKKKASGDEEDPVEEIRRQARKLHSQYEAKGGEIAQRLKNAMDIAPNEPGWLDKIGHALGDMLEDIGDFLKENADWITVAASVLGVAAIFFPPLALPAMALSAVALGAHATKYGLSGLDPTKRENIGNWLTLGGDALGAIPGFGAAYKGARAGVGAARGVKGLAALKIGISTAGKRTNFAAKEIVPAIRNITTPVEKVATRLGASTENAQRIADGVQAATVLGWTAPTAYGAARPSPGAADAANRGTALGNIVTGAGGGKFGSLVAIGSAVGLGAWEIGK